MAIDRNGRLYVTARKGVHVLDKSGKYVGLIPTPRPPITVAFSGAKKQVMYVPMMGAVGPDGQPWTTPQGVRNTGMSIYRIPVITPGFQRPTEVVPPRTRDFAQRAGFTPARTAIISARIRHECAW